ncbi:MAG: hypothetical protein DLM50_03020 [Candidatus Meridianibacter frigidus]|nr:MAG: hypothetical protein DLM50_03020 [Candidatus Eremiobacteraeota bacterium]
MPADRFFVAGVHECGDRVHVGGADARKIRTVLRKRTGDRVEIVDSGGRCFRATLMLHARRVEAELVEVLATRADAGEGLVITVAQSVPKGTKMDFVVEKLTELGVSQIVPLLSQRVIARAEGAKIARWRRLARVAAQQSGGLSVPVVADAITTHELAQTFSRYDRVLLAWELADPVALRDVLPDLLKSAQSVLAIIGPEGGFSADEGDEFLAHGATAISLGTRILRTETAALVLASILRYIR